MSLDPSSARTHPSQLDRGVAGASATAEFERRRRKRASTVRVAHPRIGGLLLALSEDPQSTVAWRDSGRGERQTAAVLERLGDTVVALHDRRVPRSRANIDHVVVGPSGVFVIDTKRYAGAPVTVRRSGGLRGPVREQLMVRGRDQTKLVAAMAWQVAAVSGALASSAFADVPVVAVLCFVDGRLPWPGRIELAGVGIRNPKSTARLVASAGPLDAGTRARLARRIADRLPSASR